MHQSTLFRLTALILIAGAAGLNTLWPRLPIVKARVLPIDTLPRVIGVWENTIDNTMDARTRQTLTEARLLSRTYQDAVGHSVELMLESSPNEGEYHLPSYCMPAQGWSIVSNEVVKVGGMDATELHIETADRKAVMLFWYVADPASMEQNSLLAKFASDRNPTRLFARVTTPVTLDYDTSSRLAHQFADASVPALSSLTECNPPQATMDSSRRLGGFP
jgi:hypothetical protein